MLFCMVCIHFSAYKLQKAALESTTLDLEFFIVPTGICSCIYAKDVQYTYTYMYNIVIYVYMYVDIMY